MKKYKTNDDLIVELAKNNPEASKRIIDDVDAEVLKIKHGGVRENSGRKRKTGLLLGFTVRLSEEEKRFIEYARLNQLDYKTLMQG